MISASEEAKRQAANLIEEGKVHEFYRSYAWNKMRSAVLYRDHYECVKCKKKGLYERATTVHHVVYALVDPKLALEPDNLISLCRECHEEIHGRAPEILTPERW